MGTEESERQKFYEAAEAARPDPSIDTDATMSREEKSAVQAGVDQGKQTAESGVQPGGEEPGVTGVMSSPGMADPDAPIK